nr:uncharacterized protein LOC114079163 [Marmota flaviventris]
MLKLFPVGLFTRASRAPFLHLNPSIVKLGSRSALLGHHQTMYPEAYSLGLQAQDSLSPRDKKEAGDFASLEQMDFWPEDLPPNLQYILPTGQPQRTSVPEISSRTQPPTMYLQFKDVSKPKEIADALNNPKRGRKVLASQTRPFG